MPAQQCWVSGVEGGWKEGRTGRGKNSTIGAAGASSGVREQKSPYSELHHSYLLTGAGYGTCSPAVLFQPLLGLGCEWLYIREEFYCTSCLADIIILWLIIVVTHVLKSPGTG